MWTDLEVVVKGLTALVLGLFALHGAFERFKGALTKQCREDLAQARKERDEALAENRVLRERLERATRGGRRNGLHDRRGT